MINFHLVLKACFWNFVKIINNFFINPTTDKKSEWVEPKFPTECYFLTLHCQHLALLPACRHHSRRIRGIRELSRMVDEMNGREAMWKGTPQERRNKQLLERWKTQIKVKYNTYFGVCKKRAWFLCIFLQNFLRLGDKSLSRNWKSVLSKLLECSLNRNAHFGILVLYWKLPLKPSHSIRGVPYEWINLATPTDWYKPQPWSRSRGCNNAIETATRQSSFLHQNVVW